MICQWNNCKNLILMDNYCPRHLKQKCAICFEKVPSTNSAKNKRLHCGHAFHLDCILQWFKESDECPICRKKQTSDSIIKFRNDIEDRMRLKYRDAIRSLEAEIRQMRN
jgi:hypothetical protein